MATRNTPFAPGTPCWVDLMSSDLTKAKDFYSDLFGWTYEETGVDAGKYVNFLSDGHKVAGALGPQEGVHEIWTTYLSTDDIEATVAAATEAGANVDQPPTPNGEVGTIAVLTDPAGASIGLWQAAKHTGFGKYNEPGSVSWDEVHSKDYQASIDFYSKVFGWQVESMSDTDDFRYSTGAIDGSPVVGIMDAKAFLPEDAPSHWTVYFSVADVDATCAKLVELGGTVNRPAEDTPFGRIADVADPIGARFQLHQPTPEQG